MRRNKVHNHGCRRGVGRSYSYTYLSTAPNSFKYQFILSRPHNFLEYAILLFEMFVTKSRLISIWPDFRKTFGTRENFTPDFYHSEQTLLIVFPERLPTTKAVAWWANATSFAAIMQPKSRSRTLAEVEQAAGSHRWALGGTTR